MPNYLSLLDKLLDLQEWKRRRLENWWLKALSHATLHLPDNVESVQRVFKSSLIILFISQKSRKCRERISSMLGSLPKSKWTIFLDNLSSSENQNTLPIQLLQIFVLESTSGGRAFQPFWMPVFKDVSERLLLPTETDFVGLDTTSSNNWLPRQVEESRSFRVLKTSLQNRNCQKTFSPSYMSSLVDKWEKDLMPTVELKTLKIRIYPTKKQKMIIDRFIDTSRFVYNRTLEHIKKGHKVNFIDLRDLLVTEKTQKGMDEYKAFDKDINDLKKLKKNAQNKNEEELINLRIKDIQQQRRDHMKSFSYTKNPMIFDFEKNTPKDIRACAVKRCCDALKSGFSNLRKGNIRHFHMTFKKKKDEEQSFEMTPKIISIHNGYIKMAPEFFKDDCLIKTHKKISKVSKIENNVDVLRVHGKYYVHICVKTEPEGCKDLKTVAGVDLGVRTFATVYSHNKGDVVIREYKHRSDLLRRYNMKMNLLKTTKGVRKKHISKIEKRKKDLVNLLHWDFINNLLSENDVIYLGDIKSQNIIKGGKNSLLNLAMKDLSFFKLKKRLIYKAYVKGKKVFLVPEHYTTKTCSCCGQINNNVGSKEVFQCDHCSLVTGRDMNASKNMILKGLFL